MQTFTVFSDLFLSMKIFGIIPARYASTRFPGKPLARIGDRTMIRRVYERCLACRDLDELAVATDDERIGQEVASFGGKVILTSPDHASGTERCGEAARLIKARPGDIVINIQGDEPFIHPDQVSQVAGLFRNKEVEIGTLVKRIASPEELFSPHTVKATFDILHRAICFSRQALPYCREAVPEQWLSSTAYYKHIGLYGYRAGILQQLVKLQPSPLEKAESLEQLRWIENGFRVHVALTDRDSLSIDTPADLLKITNTDGF